MQYTKYFQIKKELQSETFFELQVPYFYNLNNVLENSNNIIKKIT
jgi:hypothetical protein